MEEEKLARALRSKIRRNILKWLCKEKNVAVHKFAEYYELSESCASKHFKLLFDLGFLNFEDIPPEKYYSLKVKEVKNLLIVYEKVVGKL